MRLLSCKADGGFDLTTFKDDSVPPYAILSHTWNEGQEITYNELITGTGKEKAGYTKLRFCGERAGHDGLRYFWVDTCCIDKQDYVELSTAINSMFRWYQSARKCYVHLSDVYISAEINNDQALRTTWKGAFLRSRWFTRGWTLQELLAPNIVEFFSEDGKELGSKISLEQEIHEVTQIPISALRSHDFRKFSIEERKRWGANRETTVGVDMVYCLLGIFGVLLPQIYGETKEHAFKRLEREIAQEVISQEVIAQGIKSSNQLDLPKPSMISVSLLLPFPQNEHFVGRESHLKALEQWLYKPQSHRRMSIYGLGGCGKTALALEFAYQTLAKSAEYLIFWVPAISRETFEHAYQEIGRLLQIPGITDDNADVKQLVCNSLCSNSSRDWLMIIDNADDSSVFFDKLDNRSQSNRLIDYLPRNKGSILFTTRGRKTAETLSKTNILELEDMGKTKMEARQMIDLQIFNKDLFDDTNAIDELLELLTYLPLAIMQASAFINQNDIQISDYVSLFKNADSEAEAQLFSEHFEDPIRYQELESTIAKTWYISFNHIRKQDQLAADYLSFMACIDRINIPLSLLPNGESALDQMKAIGTLTGYGLIAKQRQDVQVQEKFFDVHRLVYMALRWWLQEYGELSYWKAKVVWRLDDVLPYGGLYNREIWMHYIPHATFVATSQNCVDKIARASLLDRIGKCLSALGRYSAAEVAGRETLELYTVIMGERHPLTLIAMGSLALVLDSQGKYEKAEIMIRQALSLQKEVCGDRDPVTLTSMGNLALVLEKRGKYEEAEILSQHTLALNKEIRGEKTPATLVTMNNLALVLEKRGKYLAAEAMNLKSLSLHKEVSGELHPDTLIVMSNLASLLVSQGKYEEAKPLHLLAVELHTQVLGERHPQTLDGMSNLALLLDSQGNYKEAEILNRKTLKLKTEVLGERHPETLTSMNNLASVLAYRGKYDESEAMNRQEWNLILEVLGERHPYIANSISNLAWLLERRGRYEEAEQLNRQALALRTQVLGERHPETLSSMSNLALAMRCQGRYKEAEIMNRQTFTLRTEVLGERHPYTLTSMSNLASVLADIEARYEEAESMQRQALKLRNSVLGEQHPDTLESLGDLGLILYNQGRYDEAETLQQQTLRSRKTLLGEEHPDTLSSLNNLALVLYKQGRYKEAEIRFQQTVALRKKVLGDYHPHTLISMNKLALVLELQSRYQE